MCSEDQTVSLSVLHPRLSVVLRISATASNVACVCPSFYMAAGRFSMTHSEPSICDGERRISSLFSRFVYRLICSPLQDLLDRTPLLLAILALAASSSSSYSDSLSLICPGVYSSCRGGRNCLSEVRTLLQMCPVVPLASVLRSLPFTKMRGAFTDQTRLLQICQGPDII